MTAPSNKNATPPPPPPPGVEAQSPAAAAAAAAAADAVAAVEAQQGADEATQPGAGHPQPGPGATGAEGADQTTQAKGSAAGDPAAGKIAALEEALAERDARLNATLLQHKEALEEFARAKDRWKRDLNREVDSAKRKFMTDFLEVLDNLERALESTATPQAEPAVATTTPSALQQGVQMVQDQFAQTLKRHGVTRMASLGESFDPSRHEAVSTVPVPQAEQHGTIIGVIKEGYHLGETTLRYGVVAVGQHQETVAATQAAAQAQAKESGKSDGGGETDSNSSGKNANATASGSTNTDPTGGDPSQAA